MYHQGQRRILERVYGPPITESEEANRYDESRFIDPIPENLKCAICWSIVYDPLECIECDKLHCAVCLTMARRANEKCPYCQQRMNLKGMNRTVRETMFDPLRLRCINAPKCAEIFTLATIKVHEEICPFRKIDCQLCGGSYNLITLEDHMANCPERIIRCTICDKSLKSKDKELHLTSCIKLAKCQLCQASINAGTRKQHESVCPEELVHCPLKNISGTFFASHDYTCMGCVCGERIKRKDLPEHLSQCKYRAVSCDLCHQPTQAFYLRLHQQSQCPEYVHSCTKCRTHYKVSDKHSDACSGEYVACGAMGCSQILKRKHLQDHERRCKHRLGSCADHKNCAEG